jgi:predicted DNA-binding transcriptional regulator AlpA
MTVAVLRTPEAAEYLGLSISTMNKLRVKGGNSAPPFVRISARAVGYRLSDLDAWLDAQRRTSTSDDGTTLAA